MLESVEDMEGAMSGSGRTILRRAMEVVTMQAVAVDKDGVPHNFDELDSVCERWSEKYNAQGYAFILARDALRNGGLYKERGVDICCDLFLVRLHLLHRFPEASLTSMVNELGNAILSALNLEIAFVSINGDDDGEILPTSDKPEIEHQAGKILLN